MFGFLLLNFTNALYILTRCVAQIFSPVLQLVFSFFNSVFCRKEVFNFNKVQFSNFNSMSHTFSVLSKKSSPNPRSNGDFSLVFFQKFYSFAFHSYVIFRVYLIKVIQSMSKVIMLLISNCSSNICWKGYLISNELSLHLCQRSVDYIFVNLCLGSVFSSLMYVSFLLSVLCNLDYCVNVTILIR